MKTAEEVQQPTTWIARVNLGRQMRDAGEKMVADALHERLDKVGEAKWLIECDKEWGWSRTTAYRHLNPELLEKDRERAKARYENRNVRLTEVVDIAKENARDLKIIEKILGHPIPKAERGRAATDPAPGKEVVEISAEQRGPRGRVTYTASWMEPDGGGGTAGYATLEKAMTFCPCSFDPDTVERVVIPGVWVSNPVPRDMLGHPGGYRLDENGVKIPGSEMAPALRPWTKDDELDEPETEETQEEQHAFYVRTMVDETVDAVARLEEHRKDLGPHRATLEEIRDRLTTLLSQVDR